MLHQLIQSHLPLSNVVTCSWRLCCAFITITVSFICTWSVFIMEENKSKQGMESHDRKMTRKQNRCTRYINKETGITFPNEPRKALLVGNAGLVSGLQREQVLEVFMTYGLVTKVVMLPGKSYCFVEYNDLASAEKAFRTLHGKVNLPTLSGVMYLAYADGVPASSDEWSVPLPPGLLVLPNFINEEDEEHLLSVFEAFKEESSPNHSLKNRDVEHFGYKFRYGSNDVDPSNPLERGIPLDCDFLWRNLKKHGLDIQPDQLTVNYYKPGQGIPRHCDTHSPFEEPIISLSLNSDVVMEWHSLDNKHFPLFLKRRSMLVMTGEARYGWTHGIVPRKSDIIPSVEGGLTVSPRSYRVSLTFRKIRHERFCSCLFPKLCDYQQSCSKEAPKSTANPLNDKEASKLELSHVHEVYEKIGAHFSDTRSKPWPNVLSFVLNLPSGAILLDVGCGNGKYFGQRDPSSASSVFELGCDMSLSLAEVCRLRGFEVMLNNCLALPLRSNIVDACISIAVLHHLSTEARRKQAISEIIRVLRIGGRALVYVWARDQERNKTKSSYLRQDRKNRREDRAIDAPAADTPANIDGDVANLRLPIHTNRTQFQHSDVLVPWKLKHKSAEGINKNEGNDTKNEPPTFLRFYHVFEEGEFEALVSSVEGARVQHSYYDQGNWCVIFEKVKSDVLE